MPVLSQSSKSQVRPKSAMHYEEMRVYKQAPCAIETVYFSSIIKLPKMKRLQDPLYEDNLADSPSLGSIIP